MTTDIADDIAEAPPAQRPYLFVLISGLITTALALAGVYWLNNNTDDFNIVGWYANYVIPIGAIIVGLAAGSGYALASWFTGARISKPLLLAVLALQACAWVAAEYVEYRDVRDQLAAQGMVLGTTGELPTFMEYFDIKARSFAWKSKYSSSNTDEPEALGGWGYIFILLGAVGFIGAGLIAPAVLSAAPYCSDCQRYMSRKVLGVLPASVPERKISRKDTAALEAYEKEQTAAAEAGDEALQRLRDAAASDNADAFNEQLAAAGDAKANAKLPVRIEITLAWCKTCHGGNITPALLSGKGEKVQRVKMEPTNLSPQFVQAIVASRAEA